MKNLTISLVILCCLAGTITLHSAEAMIKPGNVIYITVLGYPELSKKVVVSQDGSTNYPLFANVPIDGMTLQELKELLQPILARFVERPKLFINMDDFVILEVTVKGKVSNPGPYVAKSPISIQGILSMAGGASSDADLSNISIIRQESGEEKEIVVDLNRYFHDREGVHLPELQDQDIVFVPVKSPRSAIRVIGAVQLPGMYVPKKNEDLADLIYLAGGPAPNGNMNRIIYMSLQDGKYVKNIIKVRKLQDKGLIDQIPTPRLGDIVIVAEYRYWEDLSWWAGTLRDLAFIVSAAVVFSNL